MNNKHAINIIKCITISLILVTILCVLFGDEFYIFNKRKVSNDPEDVSLELKKNIIDDDDPWDKSIYKLKKLAKTRAIYKYPYLQLSVQNWEQNSRNKVCIKRDSKRYRAKIAVADPKDKKRIRVEELPEKKYYLNMTCKKGSSGNHAWTRVI